MTRNDASLPPAAAPPRSRRPPVENKIIELLRGTELCPIEVLAERLGLPVGKALNRVRALVRTGRLRRIHAGGTLFFAEAGRRRASRKRH